MEKVAVVAGHFTLFGLAQHRTLDQGRFASFTMLREPISRAISHYTFFKDMHIKEGNTTIPFSSLSLEQVRHVTAHMDTRYQAEMLGCDSNDRNVCAQVPSDELVARAKRRFDDDQLTVGLFEEHDASMAFLTIVRPWLGG